MKKLLVLGFLILFVMTSRGQGCIAIRNITGFGQFASLGYGQTDSKWMMNVGFRSFRSSHSFRGSVMQTDDGLVNDNRTMNFTLTRLLQNGWMVSLDLPILSNSQRLKDGNTLRVFGISDMRFTVYKWLRKTDGEIRWNLQAGLGLKLPTGKYNATDYIYLDPAHKSTSASFQTTLPGSLQPGDGGTAITTELNGYYLLNKNVILYGNFFYQISPVDQNGANSGFATDSVQTIATYNVTSVADAYSTRAGANFVLNRWVLSAGARYEGTPGHDLIGDSHGLRRAGHIFSEETGVQYKLKNGFLYSFVTIPLARATVQTNPDKVYSQFNDPNPPQSPNSFSKSPHVAGDKFTTSGHFSSMLIFVGYAFTF